MRVYVFASIQVLQIMTNSAIIVHKLKCMFERNFMRLLRLAGSALAAIAVFSVGSALAADPPHLKPKPEYQVIGEKFAFNVTSDQGSFPGLGKTYHYTDADVQSFFINIFQLGLSPTPNVFPAPNYIELGFVQGKGAKANDDWFLTLGTNQLGRPLATGTYFPATRAPFAFPNTGGLDFDLNGGGCNTLTGRYTISAIAFDCKNFDGTGLRSHLKQLVMNFEQHCDGQTPATRGQLSFVDLTGVPCDAGTGGSGGGGGGGGGTPPPTPTPAGAPTIVLPDSVLAAPVVMLNSSSTTVLFSTVATNTAADVTLTATSDSDDLLATISPAVIKAPGSGDSVLTIRTTSKTPAGDHVITITASDGTTSSSVTVFVTVLCDPPFILGIDQPKGSTVSLGRPALLSVKASGSGPFAYQWFTGASGLVNFPLAGGTTANLTTSALNDTTSYWVRVTNPCGSVDSQTATVNVSSSGKQARR